MSSPGGGQFSYTDDSVVARVAVDLPDSSYAAFAQLNSETGKLAGGLEAASRAQGNFLEHLREMPDVTRKVLDAQEKYEESLKNTAHYAERIQKAQGGGPGGPQGGQPGGLAAPQGYFTPFPDQQGPGMGFGAAVAPTGAVPGQGFPQGAAQTGPAVAPGPAGQAQPFGFAQPGIPATASQIDAAMGAPSIGAMAQQLGPAVGQLGSTAMRFASGGGQDLMSTGLQGVGQVARVGQQAAQMYQHTQAAQAAAAAAAPAMPAIGGAAAEAVGTAASSAAAGAAPAVTSAVGAAGSAAGAAGAGAAGAGAAGAAGGAAAAGGLSGVAAVAAPVAAVAGGALAAHMAIQKGGEAYQGLKDQGNLYDGGAGQGFQERLDVQTMAMSPFISTEQARQVVMGSLSAGYKPGKMYDTVTGFMADNLKDMNISVSDQVGMLQQNVQKGGQSIEGLGQALQNIQGMSGEGMKSNQKMFAEYAQMSGGWVEAGAGGQEASDLATLATGMFKDDPAMEGAVAGMTGAVENSIAGQTMILQELKKLDPEKYRHTRPESAVASLVDSDMSDPEKLAVIASPVQKALDSFGGQAALQEAAKDPQKLLEFESKVSRVASALGGDMGSSQQGQRLLKELAESGGDFEKMYQEQSDAIDEDAAEITTTEKPRPGTWEANQTVTKKMGDLTTEGLAQITGGLSNMFTDNDDPYKASRELAERHQGERDVKKGTVHVKAIDEWVKQHGGQDNIKVRGEDGKTKSLDLDDRTMIESITAGKSEIGLDEDNMRTFKEARSVGLDGGKDEETQSGGGAGTLKIESTAALDKMFNFTHTPTQTGANKGESGYTNNDPRPGDAKGDR